MPRITFVDEDGIEGELDSEMRLRYSGRFEDGIAEFARGAVENGASPPASAVQHLAVDLYTAFPLTRVEITEEERN